jgi:UDP-glucuronate 4-epimerase
VRRGFTEIRDVVSGTLAALDRDLPFAVLNLGSSDQVPLRRLVSALETALGKRANVEERILPSEEEIQTGADLTEAKALLEYAPTVQVEAGAQHFADWYLSKFLEHFPHGLAPSRFWD